MLGRCGGGGAVSEGRGSFPSWAPPQRSPFGPPSPRPMGPPLNPAPFHLQAPPPPASRWRPRPRVGVAIELKPRPLLGRGSAPSRVRRRYGRVGGGGEGGGGRGGYKPTRTPSYGSADLGTPPQEKPLPLPFRLPSDAGGALWGVYGVSWGGDSVLGLWGSWGGSVAVGGSPPHSLFLPPPPPQVLSALLGARRPYSSVFRVRRSGGGLYWGPSYGVPQYRGPFGVFPSA